MSALGAVARQFPRLRCILVSTSTRHALAAMTYLPFLGTRLTHRGHRQRPKSGLYHLLALYPVSLI